MLGKIALYENSISIWSDRVPPSPDPGRCATHLTLITELNNCHHILTAVLLSVFQKFVDQRRNSMSCEFNSNRPREDTDKLTPCELTQLRGVSGSANWLGNQTRPDLCVSTSLLQGAHASATVADTREANKVIRLCRQHAHVPIRVSPIPVDDLTLVGFGDSGWSVPRDGSAQGGSLTIAAGERILHGSKAMTMD